MQIHRFFSFFLRHLEIIEEKDKNTLQVETKIVLLLTKTVT